MRNLPVAPELISKNSELVPVFDSSKQLKIAAIVHMMTRTTTFTITLELVSLSILERFEGVAPPFSMITGIRADEDNQANDQLCIAKRTSTKQELVERDCLLTPLPRRQIFET